MRSMVAGLHSTSCPFMGEGGLQDFQVRCHKKVTRIGACTHFGGNFEWGITHMRGFSSLFVTTDLKIPVPLDCHKNPRMCVNAIQNIQNIHQMCAQLYFVTIDLKSSAPFCQ